MVRRLHYRWDADFSLETIFSSDGGQSSGVVAGNFHAQLALPAPPRGRGGTARAGWVQLALPMDSLTAVVGARRAVVSPDSNRVRSEVTGTIPTSGTMATTSARWRFKRRHRTRVRHCNLTVQNGPQKNFWVRHDGSVWTLGDLIFHNSGGHSIGVDQSPGSITLRGSIPSNIGFDYGAVH